MSIVIYTDGSCYYKDRIGGWGATLDIHGTTIDISGFRGNTTSNRMEVTAVLMAIRMIKTPSEITLYSDSMYVVNGIKAKGWMGKEDLINFDLWKSMNKLLNIHHVNPIWVRGHSGIEGNERADKLAGDARKLLLKRKRL